MRVALYARFSSDLQNERSADDQLGALRRAAEARGWIVVDAFADRGLSGASIGGRPGIQALMAAAATGRFDRVLTEALDRLSRGQADIARLYELLAFQGVSIETLSGGPVSELHIGLEGTMNRLFLVELAKKTRRGLRARVEAGFSAGGRCFGYRIVGKGVLEIDPPQAEIVRRIFGDYDVGRSPRAIAAALNAEGVKGPSGGEWTASAINGDRRAGDGILHQELYVGVRVFGRRTFRKHPETGRRSSMLNPPELWVRKPVPDLRILDDALWARVQSRKAALSETPGPRARRPKRLLSGLVVCGVCRGAMTLQGDRYACSGRRERGTCSNARIVPAIDLERRVVEGVKRHLLSPDVVAQAVREYQADMAEADRAAAAAKAPLERELAEVDRRLGRLLDMVEAGSGDVASLAARLRELEARKEDLRIRIADATPAAAYRLHPRAAEYYADLVTTLADALEADDAAEAREAFRGLLDAVVLTPLEGRGKYALNIEGRLSGLMTGGPERSEVMLGAGVGFEPTTFRL